jgi:universal stress protein A
VGLDDLKLILLPTDFSDSSGIVVRAAISVARTFDAKIEVLHVDVDPSDESLLAESIFPVQMAFDSLHKETAEQLRRVTDQVRQAGVSCTGAAELGRSPASIVEHARRVGAGLIVLGRHPGPAMGRPFHGHVADKVIHHAPCPVLVVPLPRE